MRVCLTRFLDIHTYVYIHFYLYVYKYFTYTANAAHDSAVIQVDFIRLNCSCINEL